MTIKITYSEHRMRISRILYQIVVASTIIGYCLYYFRLDAILKSIIKRQIPFLIGGTITGIIMTYYYGFLFTIIVNSIICYVISYLVSKYYYKSKGINDQKYLMQYALSKIKSKKQHQMILDYRYRIICFNNVILYHKQVLIPQPPRYISASSIQLTHKKRKAMAII